MFDFCIEDDVLKSLIRFIDNDGIKILAICITVFMGFTAIILNNYCARKRDDKKLKVEKVEALTQACIDYIRSAKYLHNLHKNNKMIIESYSSGKDKVDGDIRSFLIQSDEIHSDIIQAKGKMEMLSVLYFPDDKDPFDKYGLDSLLLVDKEPADKVSPGYLNLDDHEISLDVLKEAEDTLNAFCKKLMYKYS